MDKVNWPKGQRMSILKKLAKDNAEGILKGSILAIDPASKSLGYAVTKKGKVVDQGTIQLDARAPINERLKDIVRILQKDGEYSILAVEMIRGRMAHVYLTWSVGAVIGSAKAPVLIEIPIPAWKALAKIDPDYTKSDDADAAKLAETLIALAKEK